MLFHLLIFSLLCVFPSSSFREGDTSSSSSSYPLLPLSVVPNWPAPKGSLHYGEIRAVLNVTTATGPGASVTAQIYWRRRDNTPTVKGILGTDSNGNGLTLSAILIQNECGLVTFNAVNGNGIYYIYYLPYQLSGNDAWLHFSWYNCTDFTNHACVLGSGRSNQKEEEEDICGTVNPSQASMVIGLESRDSFQGYNETEFIAVPAEIAALSSLYPHTNPPFMLFTEPATIPVRVFNWLSARWALRDMVNNNPLAYATTAAAGHFVVFQIGVYAYQSSLTNITVSFSNLVNNQNQIIPSSSLRCFNSGGVAIDGTPFTQSIDITQGMVNSLWIGIDTPASDTITGTYTGTVSVTATEYPSSPMVVNLQIAYTGNPVPDSGASDLYSFARMKWLDSTIGLEDTVPVPFEPVQSINTSPNLNVTSLNKNVMLSSNGLPAAMTIATPKVRNGSTIMQYFSVLANPVSFNLLDTANNPVYMTVTDTVTVTTISNSSVSWTATSVTNNMANGQNAQVVVNGSLGFDSYMEFTVTITSTGTNPLLLNDVQLTYDLTTDMQSFVAGMGLEGSAWPGRTMSVSDPMLEQKSADQAWIWRWTNTTGANKVWHGRLDSGMLLSLKGSEDAWNSPTFDKDIPIIPEVPNTWGGVNALPSNNPYGVNCSVDGTILAFSGPRSLPVGVSVTFYFDIQLTPSHPLDMPSHFNDRTFQVGYGTPYYSPEYVANLGASIVTLHQGIPGIINNSLVNPYINYPFGDDVVPFLTNYTTQANGLQMRTKFYYTVRELSNHAVEIFAIKAFGDEILLQYPIGAYAIPQSGYCQDADCHGGGPWLHEHFVENYTFCWQQGLSNGEIDAAICDIGTSRWFNYYVEGLYWSVSQAPYMNGIYFDGISFSRISMQRVRRAADSAGTISPLQLRPHFDIHTGHDPTPPVCGYATHYPFMQQCWNGEGFDFTKGPEYWLVEVSCNVHGLSGDRLGGSTPSDDYKGMLYGMSQRNTGAASDLWKLWDAAQLNLTATVGYWENDPLVTLQYNCSNPAPPYHTEILSTVYTLYQKHALIAIGSFCPSDEPVTLTVDWNGLGLNPSTTTVTAPVVGSVQPKGQTFANGFTGPFTISSGNGLFLMLESTATA